MSANSGEPCCATGVASIRRVAKPKSSLRSTHMPSEVPCKPSHHRCALAIRSAQTAPPTVCAGRPSRCAGGRRIRVLHSDPRRVAVHSQALGSEFILLHCPRHPCLTLPSRGRPQAGFAHLRPPLMSNVRALASCQRACVFWPCTRLAGAVCRGPCRGAFVSD